MPAMLRDLAGKKEIIPSFIQNWKQRKENVCSDLSVVRQNVIRFNDRNNKISKHNFHDNHHASQIDFTTISNLVIYESKFTESQRIAHCLVNQTCMNFKNIKIESIKISEIHDKDVIVQI